MDDMIFSVMRILMFAVGLLGFAYEVKDSVVTFSPKIEGRVTPLRRSIAAAVNFR